MALKKTKKAKAATAKKLNIDEVAKLYATYDAEMKELKKKAEEQKAIIVEYAKNNRSKFDGSRLSFDSGVYVEIKERKKAVYGDIERIDWLSRVADSEWPELVKIGLDAKVLETALASQDKEVKSILKDVKADIEVTEVLAVYAKGK